MFTPWRVGLVFVLAFSLFTVGCRKKNSDDEGGSGGGEWKADSSTVSQLAEDYQMGNYSIRPPKGYTHKEMFSGGSPKHAWTGPERPSFSTSVLLVQIVPASPNEVLPTADEAYKLAADSYRRDWSSATFSASSQGKLGGISFTRGSFTGSMPAGGKPLRGFLYAGFDNRTLIMLQFQALESSTEEYRVAEAAALSFRRVDPKASSTSKPRDDEEDPPSRPVASARPKVTQPKPAQVEDNVEPPAVVRPMVPMRPVIPSQPMVEKSGTMIGFPFAKEFKEPAPNGGLLVGFEVGYGQFAADRIVWGLRPIYRVDAKDSFGAIRGKLDRPTTTLKAKAGYAVGGLNLKSRHWVEGFSVVYMKIDGDKLDPDDSYESAWVGWDGECEIRKLGGTTRPVIGLIGRTDDGSKALAAIGLLQ